ncbi:MAG: oligosaccharide flippase family protein [Bacteroidales bacterium]|nr:oligosaccharide flippase family protein [Bacteroidales bacterium]
MKKKFVTNLALLIFLNLLIKPFWVFGIDRTVQNVVGEQQYGLYFALFNFSLILNILLDLGITNYNNRNIAQNNQLLSKHLSNIVVLKFLLGIFYLIISVAIAFLWGYNFEQMKLLFVLAFNQFLLSFILYLRSNISGLHFFKTDSLMSVLDRSLMIIICSVLLWGNVTKTAFKIEWFIYAQTASYITTAIVAFLIVLSKAEFIKFKFNWKFSTIILRQSFPYALLVLLMSFYTRFDGVLLERLLTDGGKQAGIYAQAFRVLDAASMFSLLFAGLLLPMFAKMIKQKQSVNQLTQLSFLLLITPSIIVSISSFFYRNEIINLLYHNHVEISSTIFGVLMFAYVFVSTSYIFGTLLTANGSMKVLNTLAIFGVAINLTLNFILIPKYNALGSAIANLSTQSFIAISQILISKKIFKFKINLKLISTIIIYVAGIFILGQITKDLPYNWIFSFSIMIVLSAIFAFGIKLFNIKDIYKIIKYGD